MNATPDDTLADAKQRIADLERQLAECKAERDEALAQQTATAEILQVINASPGDLAPVLDAILEKAHRLCGASLGALTSYDGKLFHRLAMHGYPPEYEALLQVPSKPSALSQKLLDGARHLHVADLAMIASSLDEPLARAAVEIAGVRTALWVALRKDGRLLGYFNAYRREVRPYSEKEIALLENFAAQAVIAMENARLLTETREALEQQTATAEVLQVINASPGDLAPVFEAMLEKATWLCEASFGMMNTYDGQRLEPVARHGVPAALVEKWSERNWVLGPGIAPARIVGGEDLIHTVDLMATEAYQNGDPARRALVDLGGARTYLIVALRKDGALLGTIAVYRQEVRAFTDKQIALLENFAAQAVIAMENARLLTETREALEQQTATAEVLQVINSSPGDLAPVFDAMLEKAMRLCGAAFGSLYVLEGDHLRSVAQHGVPEAYANYRATNPPSPTGVVLAELQRKRPIHVLDMKDHERYRAGYPDARAMVDLAGARTTILVPLVRDETFLGYISVFRQEVRAFSDKQIALLESFAAQAVIAIENARLLTETREALEQQTATAEVLQVINSSPGDLAPVFDAILDKARTLCEGTFGALFLAGADELFRAVAMRGGTAAWHERIRRGFAGSETPASAPFLAGESFVHIVDLANIDHPMARAAVGAVGVRTFLSVPLRKDNTVLGMIFISRGEVRPFNDKQIALLRNFSAQAVIAMENARLLGELRQRTAEVAELNRGLEARVAEQVEELGRVGRLKRFLAPQLAELIVSQGDEKILESHRREIVVVFCDLRGYTAFTETAEPEEVLDFLRDYHGALGPLVTQFEGTLDQFSGDGIMVFFNDPVPIPDPAERAIRMAVAMREAAEVLIAKWRRRGRELGFGAGIAQGYATLGQIGFAERSGYTAIGTVCNLAARLCAEAKDGQILLAQRLAVSVEEIAVLEEIGPLSLKGLTQPIVAYNVPLAASQLRVDCSRSLDCQ
jgi:GAF domain-containing protein